jgi:quinol monooxygenase YgiN
VQEDPTKFVLVEVYKDQAAPAKHKETAHYAAWRDAVADMMAVPRSATKYSNIFPAESSGWDVPAALASGAAESGKDDLLAVHVFVSVKPGTEDAFKAASLDNAQNSVQVCLSGFVAVRGSAGRSWP